MFLIDEELQTYYITAHKCISIISFAITVVLLILSIFYLFALVFLSAVTAFICVTFFITYRINKNKYGRKICCVGENLIICDYKGKKTSELDMSSLKKDYLQIAFDYGRPRYIYKQCLILHNNFELYERMEYSSYWNNHDLVIVQNQKAIETLQMTSQKK